MSGGKFGNPKMDYNPEFSEPDTSSLLSVGQVKQGDRIHLTNSISKQREFHDAVKVLHAGKPNEEILLDERQNLYFITSMAIDGTSWADAVSFG